jgi:hypothetical protein
MCQADELRGNERFVVFFRSISMQYHNHHHVSDSVIAFFDMSGSQFKEYFQIRLPSSTLAGLKTNARGRITRHTRAPTAHPLHTRIPRAPLHPLLHAQSRASSPNKRMRPPAAVGIYKGCPTCVAPCAPLPLHRYQARTSRTNTSSSPLHPIPTHNCRVGADNNAHFRLPIPSSTHGLLSEGFAMSTRRASSHPSQRLNAPIIVHALLDIVDLNPRVTSTRRI